MPEPILSLGVISAVLVSAVVQRVSGFGFGLVLAPPLVVLLGSHQGVMLANFLSIIAPLFIMPRVWRDIDWRRFRMLALPALLVIPIAAWFSTLTPPGFLDIIVALMIIVGLICTVHIASTTRQVDGAVTVTLTGIGAGIGTAVAGVGAPATTIYAVLSGWATRAMVATLQPLWLLLSAMAFLTKSVMDQGHVPDLPWQTWFFCALAILGGILLGERIQNRVADHKVRRFVIALAFVGAAMALGSGIMIIAS
ncbi:sulfite exporter TauE/SafE family protein [Nesterenkonia aerolata]|uniref:Probable membrane transporter protein n=1 Tax=Nesterenkonia aerolata TaxID=3074079 RepID=A0ABU2DUC6_9MICC|nr:sulfite exporter TauE/SafE family protein [Nesterenkonia sp. LY-0111]MDR8020099.1 sulfite exporter TauE/SafE family protein [Nesterenkonia sp. LY-0111]